MRAQLIFALGLVTIGATGARAETVVTLSFDDTFADQAQLKDMLAARGMHATFYVNSARLGEAGYMTAAEVTALQDAGNEIGGHTIHHNSLTALGTSEAKRQICDDRAALLARGYHATSFAYPRGADELETRSLVASCGYNSGRDASSLRSHGPESCTSCAWAETMPPRDSFGIRTPVSIKDTNTLADLQLTVTEVEAHGGGWVPFVFHHVCDGCGTNAVSPAIMAAFLDWLAPRLATGTRVATTQEVIGGAVQPAVAGPPPVQYVAEDGNLLRNASLETNADGDLVPDCWRVGAGSADASSYAATITGTSHSGAAAEQLQVMPGSSAAARIYTFQDLGACAPSMAPGDTFHVSAWYLSSDVTRLVAYYRTTAGWWRYLAQGPVLAPTAAYALAEWTTPAAPADATAISVGIGVEGAGTLWADDFRLTNTATPPPPPPTDDGGSSPLPDLAQPSADGGEGAPDLGAVPGVDAGVIADAATAGADLASSPADLATGTRADAGCSMSAGPPGAPAIALAFAMLVLLRARRRAGL